MFITPKYPNKRFQSVEQLNEFTEKRKKILENINKLKFTIKKVKVATIRKIFP